MENEGIICVPLNDVLRIIEDIDTLVAGWQDDLKEKVQSLPSVVIYRTYWEALFNG